jgi:hypothetical protein
MEVYLKKNHSSHPIPLACTILYNFDVFTVTRNVFLYLLNLTLQKTVSPQQTPLQSGRQYQHQQLILFRQLYLIFDAATPLVSIVSLLIPHRPYFG